MRWILGNVDHRSKHALGMKMDHMLLNELSALIPIRHGNFQKNKFFFLFSFFCPDPLTTLMNNAFDAAENTFILTVCLRILGNRIFHSKKENDC